MLSDDLPAILSALADDEPLAPFLRDHALTGDWLGFRDCHIKPDLVLIYQITENELLLARLGTHSQLNF